MRITVTIPTVHTPMIVANLLGLIGLAGIAVAVGALAGDWWWSVLIGSVFATGLAWVASTHAQASRATSASTGSPARPASTQLRPAA